MWLYGYVGCGKSTIAQEVAEIFARRGMLGASFFFFRGAGDRSKIRRFAATLAAQIMAAYPYAAFYIRAAMKRHLDLFACSIQTQFQRLIYDPLVTALNRGLGAVTLVKGPMLIVIDGLDDCEDQEDVAAWITHAISFFNEHPRMPLRFLISSRVEEHIRVCLQSTEVKH